jgi:hypothetical protein
MNGNIMKISPRLLLKYPLPDFLIGSCTQNEYFRWLRNKADTLLKRDKKRGKPYAASATRSNYEQVIHQAILTGGLCDPFTGEALDWKLIGTWDTTRKQPDGYKKEFALMPTVDHVREDSLEFEICSFRVNEAKADLEPDKFVELCKKVAAYRLAHGQG